MGTIKEVSQRVAEINLRLTADLQQILQDNAALAVEMVGEQHEAGLDGYGQPLTPSYLDDPYFNDTAHPQVAARNYVQWKERITPPQTTWRLMLPPRAPETPNLRINGYYRRTISATPISGGLRIGTDDMLGGAVTAKYGDDRLYKLGVEARTYIAEEIIMPFLRQLFGK